MPHKGTPMSEIYRGMGPWLYEPPPIHPSKYHTILYQVPAPLNKPPKPHRSSQVFHWDEGYVYMPYSDKNLFPSKDDSGKDILISRWELIQETLLQPIESSRALEAAIKLYNTKLSRFTALHHLFEEVLSEEETDHFFKTLLPKIINLALQLPVILPGSIPLLKTGACKSISLSQLQIGSLLANAFLCTLPWKKEVAATYPGPNFSSLFSAHSDRADMNGCVSEKIKCILHYFRRITSNEPVGVVTFERQHIRRSNIARWDKSNNNLGNTRIHISSTGTIEDDGMGLCQMDFANKYIGGGVLGFGCVQEEIRFVICPELLISRLFTEVLANTESLIMRGAERFSKYTGYGDNFAFAGNFVDETPYDKSGHRKTLIVAIDATLYHKPAQQYHTSQIFRELGKAYTGFHSRFPVPLPAVATGNWGCGAFRGDPELKFLIQLMACSAANRDMVYYTFGDEDLVESIYAMHTFIATNKIEICQLWRILCRFAPLKSSGLHLYPFIQQSFFDLKSQPSITTFYRAVKTPDKEKPTTSNNNVAPTPSVAPLALDSPISLPLSIRDDIDTTPVKLKRKKPDTSPDLFQLIAELDGQKTPIEPKSASENVNDNSFLGSIDQFMKKKAGVKEACVVVPDEVEEMDVEGILEELSPSKNNGEGKKKITDYFKKM